MNKNLVEITDKHFIVDLMYAGTEHNMTGSPVYQEIGLGNRAFVHRDLWNCLQKLIPYLENTGRFLKIYDAYRPVEAHKKLFEAVPRDGFFIKDAAQSPHCRGTAVDAALTDKAGKMLLYPTEVDAYTPEYAAEVRQGQLDNFFEYLKKASLDYNGILPPKAVQNRDELCALMKNIGLVPPPRRHEWWHFELPDGRGGKYQLITD